MTNIDDTDLLKYLNLRNELRGYIKALSRPPCWSKTMLTTLLSINPRRKISRQSSHRQGSRQMKNLTDLFLVPKILSCKPTLGTGAILKHAGWSRRSLNKSPLDSLAKCRIQPSQPFGILIPSEGLQVPTFFKSCLRVRTMQNKRYEISIHIINYRQRVKIPHFIGLLLTCGI